MRVFRWSFVVMIVITGSAGCFGAETIRGKEKTDEQIIVEGNNKFGLELYGRLCEGQGNIFFSPYSISTALAMTCAGARGRTEQQMAEVLNFPRWTNANNTAEPGCAGAVSSRQRFHSAFGEIINSLNAQGEKGSYELSVANALWGQKDYRFLEKFVVLIESSYKGGLYGVDFVNATEAARQRINSWVEKQTNNRIKELIKKGLLDRLTRLVLTNAIYFKGDWARQFEQEKTEKLPFTLPDDRKVSVAMMQQTARFKYMETDALQCLELPYADNELSMIVLLPKEPNGLGLLEQSLDTQRLSGWFGKLAQRKVSVYIPKFEMTSQFSLADVLASMGMTDAFTGAADFSGMTGAKDLFISAVVHKAYVKVNEEGTEAAAATAVTMKLTAVRPAEPVVFRADHPFLFVIRDNRSESILFVGRVANPQGQ